jgi:hypothetical protein
VIIETFHNRKTKWKQEVQNNFCLHAKLKNENGVVFGDIIVEQMKKIHQQSVWGNGVLIASPSRSAGVEEYLQGNQETIKSS